ncbi:PREDICTED: ATP-binding cassette sub-family G member 1-like isoform X3 [Vollenhovia emeryi]|uniref:ATP-binding cassette sub-family G member 1-like isoform X3 n=1 Tax=Vollenhovia emeryi TaxID=411798 RepID=UPI0005F3C847|nr:PREDICTED: ATP-binding cassette sub-family G member 1-like isoform X3 [Vollenhovia emeryi]
MDPTSENNVNGVGNGIHKSMKDTLDNGNGTMSHLSRMAAVDIEFNDVTYSVKTGPKEFKMLLKGVSGQFKSGELTVILGPSGAGKSTLLNVLAGYRCMDIGGSIRINGQLRDVQKFKKMSRYIMQDNMTQPNLTVFEAMSFAADFKLGKRKSRLQKRAAINEILSILRLTGTQNTVTDKLSGGEKKRLTIALELVNNPPVIFLDEPTCGLDNLSSTKCVDILKRLAHLGRTVVCSMHTPSASAFNKFDHVYILTNGQCVYRDTASNVVPFMRDVGLECPKHYSPADFIPSEVKLMAREHFNGWYNLSAYYWALTVVSIPLQIIFGFCYLTIIYLITGQPLELHRSSIFFGTCFVCAFISESIGQNIGSMFNPVNSMVIGSIISCPLILTAIQDFGVETTGPRPLFRTIFMYTSHLRYGLEGLTTAIYGYGRQRIPCPTEEFYCHFSSPKEIMQIIGMERSLDFWMDISALFIILFISKGITYYFLRQRVQPNKTFQMFQVIRNLFKNHFNI